MSFENLKTLFNPKTVAVIGATNKKGTVGYDLMKNLTGSGYEGIIFPVNPNRTSVYGIKTYPSIQKTPDKIDLAIIATPAKTVPDLVEQCGKAGVKGIVIISAGFSEIGKHGKALVDRILQLSKKYDMRIIGPNCLGFINPSISLNASFANKMALPGKIAFISQSGALCTSILDWSVKTNVGFSHFVSIGSMIDVSFDDLIDYFGRDAETQSIVIYMESLTKTRRFLSAARAFSRTKPIILLKTGKSIEGAKAAMSHTGSIAGNDAVFDAAFKRAGIIRVDTIGELFDCAKTLSMQKRPTGKRLAVVTNAGGPGVIVTDTLIDVGGELADLSADTVNKLNEILPPAWSRGNPVDVLGDAPPERYSNAVQLCLDDPNTDGVLVILTPQSMTDSAKVAEEIVALPNRHKKTLLASWMGEDDVRVGEDILEKNKIPCFAIPEDAVKSFINMYNYSKNLELLYETPPSIPDVFTPTKTNSKKLIKKVVKDNRFVMTEYEAKQFLSYYDIPVTKNAVAKTSKEAGILAGEIGFPVAMKILSPDILHKTDVNGVKLNIMSQEDARKAFDEIVISSKNHNPEADIHGVLIEQMVSKKYELIIGCKKDPHFGPAIVFGMGGVAVDIFKDTTVGLPPLNMALAKRMIEETKIYNLLKGYRGMKGVDLKSIQFLLCKFAYLLSDFPEIKEIDINPFGIDENGGIVLDAKVVLDEDIIGKKIAPYSHMVISPYPEEYISVFRMKNGVDALLRPIMPEDEFLEEEMFSKFSERTQRFRFFQLIKNITHEQLISYTQIDYAREIAIIAEVKEKRKKKMAGVVRLIADPYNETAEFAIVVADPWHNLGLGNKFTDYILEIAKKRRIRKVCANVLHNNHIMLHMFRKRGFTITKNEEECYAELKLR
ncbi:MAG: bifunctional acetate--CoA ligase family protein/GNAT family N-acetyltransferase [Candidatus Latescibacteria bacterium]|jgi:acetyltransferase|nr:bifunctional acetate--CoA ligase family protein/GNAT family N-acetyltransferase [Candidatus Latescibacterota bacterium]